MISVSGTEEVCYFMYMVGGPCTLCIIRFSISQQKIRYGFEIGIMKIGVFSQKKHTKGSTLMDVIPFCPV